jgi:hypothetical protein
MDLNFPSIFFPYPEGITKAGRIKEAEGKFSGLPIASRLSTRNIKKKDKLS